MSSKPLNRKLIKNPEDALDVFDTIELNGSSFFVKRHWFWAEFTKEWEESTWRFYSEHVDPRGMVIDLGAWIGPTILFAAAAGARQFLAVEGNPETVEHLRATQGANHDLLSGLVIHNGVVHTDREMVSFGNKDGSTATSSASSTRGHGFQVQGLTIQDTLNEYQIRNASIIKIDIEGSEIDVIDQIAELSKLHAPILLSLHPPFWSKPSDVAASEIISALSGFQILTIDGKELDSFDIRSMVEYDSETPPSWGTPWGNFFEVVLKPRTGISRI